MDIKIFDKQVDAASYTVKIFQAAIDQGAEVFGLATGSTPIPVYDQLVASDIDFSECVSINLDEYYGLNSDHPQSYHQFMADHLFNKKPFKKSYLPDGATDDLPGELARYDQIIQAHPIDLQILGIGENGHIGFNEPGAPMDGHTQLVQLTDSTIQANARFFTDPSQVPTQAISMGLASISSAKQIVLLAFGANKADAIAKTVNGPLSNQVPASILKKHDNVTLILDQGAASQL
ncbi:glucosamine-6-phosphate deaminase [Aerococcus kribbianus]|uniref:Glucosamine-6-phosphate deaminase n=1 Tax=Aerococcus kribbianus TaxID=2999064 RepID=A0A9X3JFZ3_9LACT|nr:MULTISPECIES: glucosamine-6-phosphate deaminase [unclassified Aerococcus]MCZ0717547.1 glucosamine-6-phosphate deaminase [Aerococcus sp. YH-aer221]MCZ0725835.1 glucosamine-6-phosphate deaminase [Aerococcus sp. YH-aer222]